MLFKSTFECCQPESHVGKSYPIVDDSLNC
jgi:hypothetical protein